MRLTVGPLPAAVYWRRRVVVFAALALVVLAVVYACGGNATSNAGAPSPTSTPPATTPQPTDSLLHPIIPTTTTTTATSPTATPFSLTTSAASGPCTDDEMSVTAKAAGSQVQSGQSIDLTITIKNISTRTCSRDIGADVQELRIMDGTAIVWSSDDCDANHGHNVQSFSPGKSVSYRITWYGARSRTGTGDKDCTGTHDPAAKTYQLIARLADKLSEPFDLTVRG